MEKLGKKKLGKNLKQEEKARQECRMHDGNKNLWFMRHTLFTIINSAHRLLMHQKEPDVARSHPDCLFSPFLISPTG